MSVFNYYKVFSFFEAATIGFLLTLSPAVQYNPHCLLSIDASIRDFHFHQGY